MHECGFCLQAKNGFQYLCQYGRFSKIQSQLYKWYASQVSSQIQGCEGPQLVNSSFTIVTPLGATWMIRLYDYLVQHPEITKNGFQKAGLL